MGQVLDRIDARLERFIEKQRVFFVATAPGDGHVNLSPKGLDTFRILTPTQVAYLDLTGSGAETAAHLKDNGRITFMFMALEGPPLILRLYGRGRVAIAADPDWDDWCRHFPTLPGVRAVVTATIHRAATSCGYGVPVYGFKRERPTLADWAGKKGSEGLAAYRAANNEHSIDGLPTDLLAHPAETTS